MLFVAPEFLLAFLPAALVVYWLLEVWKGGRWSMGMLLLASLFFYGWSGLDILALFVGSLSVNFALGHWIARSHTKWPLVLGVSANLALLALFKYADFGMASFGELTGIEMPQLDWRLPLAISFYTFQQIAYLVQCHDTRKAEIPWRDYALAVAFFPHLIAGPLVHYRDLVAQFHSQKRRMVAVHHFHEGLSLFVVALGKKLLIADSLSPISGQIFAQVKSGAAFDTADAWLGALAYTFQIYFDFSAYSEMAIGLGLMFGIRLPVNFKRPYAAVDMRDFWRRWHITLSEFLRDYLYIPLGGNRKGPARRWFNLFLTMLLGGLWHGAGWTFLVWGALHGVFLACNHAWAQLSPVRLPRRVAQLVTFCVVVFLWVPFRAENWTTTARMWQSMIGLNVTATQPMTTIPAKQEVLDMVINITAGAQSSAWNKFVWNIVSTPVVQMWFCVLLAALLAFQFRSNLDLSTSPLAKSTLWALYLGALLFAVAARNFHAAPGEFLYFRF